MQKVGNLSWLEKNYKFQKIAFAIDELIVLNASRNNKSISEFSAMLNSLVNSVFIPIAAGGGVRHMEDASILFKNGADKIVLNSVFVEKPSFIRELVKNYGTQSIVASIDYKKVDGKNEVFINNGNNSVSYSLIEYIKYIEDLGVGEIYLNSIDKDGSGFGYDLDTIKDIGDNIKVPLIFAGGAGNEAHLLKGLKENSINAVATANLFNFIGDGLPNARKKIIDNGINIANWNDNI
ncbi:MAG TPA: HisA/HisF-related TIM barrel protein [Leadbetterella sp.]|nr:HisA/HisF-related TIM barrel protein [Leadbetterella sp.]